MVLSKNGDGIALGEEPSYVDVYGQPVLANYQCPEWREHFIKINPCVSETEVLSLAGTSSEKLKTLIEEGRLIRLWHRGSIEYPLFQFCSNGQALPIIAELIKMIGISPWVGWEVACFLEKLTYALGEDLPLIDRNSTSKNPQDVPWTSWLLVQSWSSIWRVEFSPPMDGENNFSKYRWRVIEH